MLAIDPGINGCGVAEFDNGVLGCAYYVPATERAQAYSSRRAYDMAAKVMAYRRESSPLVEGWVEWPQVYRAGRSKGDPNDLLLVAGVAGALGFNSVLPAEWKGQLPKEVVMQRVKAALSYYELGCVELPAKSLQHNVWDAIGIGLFACGRFNPRRGHGSR